MEGAPVDLADDAVVPGWRPGVEQRSREIDEMAELASHLAAATARFVELVWRHAEHNDGPVAPFIAYRCGIPGHEAAEYLRVATALRELPLTRAAFARGELSYAKVRALTRVATAGSEEGLVDLAGLLTASQLQRALRAYRRITAEETRDAHEVEFVRWCFDEDGSLLLRGRLAAEDGTIVAKALEAARDRVLERRREERGAAEAVPARLEELDPFGITPDPPRSTHVEAFVELAQAALAVDAAPDAPVTRLVVHVDAAALVGDGSGCCELEDGPVISPVTARRLGCDAETLAQVEMDGLPVDLGRARRTVTPTQRRLLEALDGRACVFPGCERRRHLQAHHRVHWLDGGETNLANLTLLCFHHHRLVHEGGYTIDDNPAGGLIFRNRAGLRIQTQPPKPPPGSLDQLLHDHTRRGLQIDPDTNRHGAQDGITPFDLSSTVWAIHAHLKEAREAEGLDPG